MPLIISAMMGWPFFVLRLLAKCFRFLSFSFSTSFTFLSSLSLEERSRSSLASSAFRLAAARGSAFFLLFFLATSVLSFDLAAPPPSRGLLRAPPRPA